MPNVRLTRREVYMGWLPDVCAVTGQPTEERVNRRFDTLGWLLFLCPVLIAAWVAGWKSVTISLPMVPERRGYWLRRTIPSFALLTTTTSISIGGFVLIWSGQLQMVGMVAAVTGTVLALASYFHWMFMWESGVRVSYVTDRWVKLNNVHPAIAEALDALREEREARRQPGEQEDDAEREARWRRRRRVRAAQIPPE